MTIHLLGTLKAHPQRSIAAFAQILISAAHSLPRSNNAAAYPTERSFVLAHAKWRAGVRAQITAFTRGKERDGDWLELEPDEEQGEDEQDLADLARSFETFFMHVADLLLGETQAVLRESEEWTGAVAVWGVLVEPGLKRDDLPCVTCLCDGICTDAAVRSVMEEINATLPPALDIIEDKAQHALCMGELTQVCLLANHQA